MRKVGPTIAGIVLALAAVPLVAAAAAGHDPGRRQAATPHPAVPRSTDGVPRFSHVFLVIGENTSLRDLGPGVTPYLVDHLKPRAAWLTDYRALASGSLANYIGMTSGQYLPCDVNDALPYNFNTGKPTCAQDVNNLFHQLDQAGLSWTDWSESEPNPCGFIDTGEDWAGNVYTTHHNPAVYYDDIEGRSYQEAYGLPPRAECVQRVRPAGTTAPDDMSYFNAALAAGRMPVFNLVIPNDCEDGHDPCGSRDRVGQFDAFLRREVPRILDSAAFGPDGLLLITYDEQSDAQPNDPRVAFLAIGGLVRPGVYSTGPFTHYSLLRTLEDGYGLEHLGAARTALPIAGIWRG